MQMTIPTELHAYHLEKFRFDLQRFASGTVTPTSGGLKNGSTIKVTFKDKYGYDNYATFTYNDSFSETHSGGFINVTRANISNNNIVIEIDIDNYNDDFTDSDYIDTIKLDTANNNWILAKGKSTDSTSDYSFTFNDTTISYDSNNAFSSNFSALIYDYTITINDKTYSVGFDNSGNLTSVNGTALSNGRVTLDGKTYNFSGNTSSITYSYNEWTVDSGVAKYGADSNVLVAIDGLKNPTATDGAISGLTVDETAKTVTVASNLLGEKDVKINDSSDYMLKLADGVTAPQTTGGSFESLTYKSGGVQVPGYTLSSDKKTVNYFKQGDIITLFTLSGVANTTGITVDETNKTVTLTAANFNSENVTFSANEGEYTFALASGTEPQDTVAGFDEFTYRAAGGKSAGYTLSDDAKSVTYAAEVKGTALFTLEGVKSTDGITVADKVVTLTAANLDGKNVTFSETKDGEEYTFALSGIGAPQTTGEGFDGFSYKSVAISTGYTLSSDKKSVNYTAASGGDTLFTLSGVENTNGITVNGNVVTLNAANLNKNNVTVDGGYTLALKDVASPTQTKAAGFDGTSYKSATFSEGYTASGNTITYEAASGGDTLFTLSGVKNTNGITVDETKKIVTLTAANLNKKNVTVDGGYQLALGSDVAYKASGAGGYYSLNSEKNAVTYNAAVVNTNIIVKGKFVTLTSGANGTFNAKNFTKVDGSKATNPIKIIGGNSASTLSGGAKNDSLWGGASNDKLYGNAGNDSLAGGAGNDKLWGNAGNDKIYGNTGNDSIWGNDGNDVLAGSSGNDSLAGGAGNDKLWGNAGNDKIYGNAGNDSIWGNDGNDVLAGSSGNDSLNGGAGDDKLWGNAGNDKIYGNAGNDSIWGNDGNDVLAGSSGNDSLNGGAGDDKLWGNAGNDKIYGNAGNDSIWGNDGNDVLAGSSGNDNLNGGAGDDKLWGNAGNDKIYGNAGNDSIWGNDGNDVLAGSSGNDSLNGGAGNDKLWGNVGKDTFIYAPGDGKDIIYDFEDDDMLKITGKFSASYDKQAKEIYFDVGSTANAITLKDFSATSVNVNGTDYKIQLAKRR